MKLLSCCLFAAAGVFVQAQYPGAAPVPGNLKKGFDSIKVEDARAILSYLAGPETEGRGTIQAGFLKAADFVAARFKAAGLKPVGDKGTYFQMVHFASTTLIPGSSSLTSADGKTRYTAEGEIAFGNNSKDANLKGDVVFIRANGKDAKLPGDVDLRDKIVVLAATAVPFPFRQAVAAMKPSAVLVVQDQVTVRGSNMRPVSLDLSRVAIARTAAIKLALDQGTTEAMVDASSVPDHVDIIRGTKAVTLTARYEETDAKDVPNVVGLLEGSDRRLKSEIVGVGAHLDHLGKVGDTVYPGADDDGSGSTAVLEIVNAMHVSKAKPKRSILFMCFCGEEMGLLGSGWYSDHPIFPHDNMVAELQMDMVGRDSDGVQNGDRNRVDKKEENVDTIRLVGSKRISTDLDNLIMENNKYVGFKFKYDAEDVYTRSDHYNFAKHMIPIAFLFDGFHPDYHRPTDTVDKINFVKLTNAAKLYYITALDLANRKDRPRKDVPQTGQ